MVWLQTNAGGSGSVSVNGVSDRTVLDVTNLAPQLAEGITKRLCPCAVDEVSVVGINVVENRHGGRAHALRLLT